ncbi:MAG: hypothetical protein CM15mP62_30550 [Rhodospirillaceae bacterium]|nr:MAG: hypothetical protein CM15mP62_30550 [Rhodospirillaceae bacterium]
MNILSVKQLEWGMVRNLKILTNTIRNMCIGDILIVGGGPTGISAAVTAGRAGARVILVDNHPKLGGQLNGERYFLDKKPAHHWVEQCVEELDGLENVTIATRTSAFGYYDSDVVNAIESVSDHLPEPLDYQCRQRLWQIRAKK